MSVEPPDGLPGGWALTELRDVATVNPSQPDSIPADDASVSFVPMSAVEVGTGRLDPSQHRLWREVKRGYTRFQEGDVLFAKITPSMENGKCALATGLAGKRGAGSTEFHVLRANPAVTPEYILYFLLRESYRREARLLMKGVAGQLRVPPEFMAASRLPLAPLPEQRHIVAEIEKQFTRLDAAVAALESAQEKLKRYHVSVLKAACEGRLVPTEAELAHAEGRDYEPAEVLLKRILKERRAKWEAEQLEKMKAAGKEPKDDRWKARYKEPAATETEGLPEPPEGWAWVTFGDLLESFGSGSAGVPQDRQTDIPILRSSSVRQGALNLNDVRYVATADGVRSSDLLANEDLLFVRLSGSIDYVGNCAMVRGLAGRKLMFPDRLFRARLSDERLARCCEIAFGSELVRRGIEAAVKSTAGHQRISMGAITEARIPVPPLTEQERIAGDVERRLSVANELEIALDHDIRRASRLRQSILKRAFQGKLVPQDPNDEPASVLLEHIRRERVLKAGQAAPRQKRRTGRKAT